MKLFENVKIGGVWWKGGRPFLLPHILENSYILNSQIKNMISK